MLLILSHVQHTCHGDRLYAYGPYVREIEEWAALFEHVVIAAPCREEAPPGDALAFAHKNIAVVPMPEFSGGGLLGRLHDAIVLPACMLRLCRLLWQADAVHVRCPGSIGLLGLLLAPAVFRVKRVLGRDASNVQRPTSNVQRSTFKSEFPPDTRHLTPDTCSQTLDHRPRTTDHGPQFTHHASRITHPLPLIAKYAGQWNGYPGEAWTYRLQRWLLKSRWWGAPVTVYGEWPNQPRHVIPFFTSILTEQQMGLARESAQHKADIGKAESRNGESREQKQSEPQTQRLTPRQPRSAGGECAEHGAGSAEAEYQSPERSERGNGWKDNPVTLGRDGLRSGLCSQAASDVGAPNAVREVAPAGAEHDAGSAAAGNQSPKRSAGGGGSKGTPSLSAAAAFVPGSVGCSDSDSGLCPQAAPDVGAPNAVRGVAVRKATPSLSTAAAFVPGSVGDFDSGFRTPGSGRCVDSVVRVLFVGRLSRAKHVDAVIAAVAAVRAKGLAVECTIAGDGPERKRLEALAGEKDGSSRHPTPDTPSPKRAPRIPHPESGIPHHRSPITDHRSPPSPPWVRFTGGLPFDQVLDCYREHDVLVLASETEGWPKAIAEAMAFGLICIGSNRSIIPQMLGDGRGFLVEPGDQAGLVARLQQITSMSASERVEMSRRAAAWGQRYTLENLREALRELMDEWWWGSTCNNSMAG